MSILNRVSFLDGDKDVHGGRPCTCLPEEKARRPCLRHTFGSYLRGSPRDRLGIRRLGRASICWVNRDCFPSLPFPYIRPRVLRRLGPSCSFPYGLFSDSVRLALWDRGCLRTEHGSSETGCWLIGSIGWFIHSIRTVNCSASSVPDVCSRESSTNQVSVVKPRSATTWFCFIFNFIVCVWVVCLQAYLYTTWVPCDQGGQKRGSDTLKLDLRNSGSLEKQSAILTTKPFPQPSITCVFVNKVLLGYT